MISDSHPSITTQNKASYSIGFPDCPLSQPPSNSQPLYPVYKYETFKFYKFPWCALPVSNLHLLLKPMEFCASLATNLNCLSSLPVWVSAVGDNPITFLLFSLHVDIVLPLALVSLFCPCWAGGIENKHSDGQRWMEK